MGGYCVGVRGEGFEAWTLEGQTTEEDNSVLAIEAGSISRESGVWVVSWVVLGVCFVSSVGFPDLASTGEDWARCGGGGYMCVWQPRKGDCDNRLCVAFSSKNRERGMEGFFVWMRTKGIVFMLAHGGDLIDGGGKVRTERA